MRREACFRGTAAWFADPAAIVRPPGTDGWQNRSASHQSNHDPDEDHSRQPVPPIRIECLRGEAIVRSEEQIQWRSGSSEWTSEQLTSERTPEEIMLDVFGRRVVGGLIPVARLEDILRPGELLAALEKS